MIKKLAVFVFALTVFTTVSHAQYTTGDAKLDAFLGLIDEDAKKDPVVFSKDMSTTYKVPETQVKTMSESGMKSGDIFMVLETSKITKKPVDEVSKVYQANKQKGWGAIAKELGIKPGSAEFKALKSSAETKSKKGKDAKPKSKK